jgi:hypothetical protein
LFVFAENSFFILLIVIFITCLEVPPLAFRTHTHTPSLSPSHYPLLCVSVCVLRCFREGSVKKRGSERKNANSMHTASPATSRAAAVPSTAAHHRSPPVTRPQGRGGVHYDAARTPVLAATEVLRKSPASSPSHAQQQRSPRYRAYNATHHPHHHHHHHHQRQTSLSLPSPHHAQQHSNSSSSHHHYYSSDAVRHSSPPLYEDLLSTPASAAGSTSSGVVMQNGGLGTPSFSPFSSPPLHGRYRSSLPLPPPLRSLPTPTVAHSSSSTAMVPATITTADTAATPTAAKTPARTSASQQQQVEPSRRPEPHASLQRHLPPQLSIASVVLPREHSSSSSSDRSSSPPGTAQRVHGDAAAEGDLSTPVDQCFPAMAPPTRDVFDVNADGAAAMLAYRGPHRRRSCQRHPRRRRSRVSVASSAVATETTTAAAAANDKDAVTASLPARPKATSTATTSAVESLHPSVMLAHVTRHLAQHREASTQSMESQQAHVCDSVDATAAAAAAPAPPLRVQPSSSSTHADAAHDVVVVINRKAPSTCTATFCGVSDWRSPSSATRGMWRPQQLHATSSSIDASGFGDTSISTCSSNDDGAEDADGAAGLLTASLVDPRSPHSATTPFTTPARAPAAVHQLRFSSVEDVSVHLCGQCSTPREPSPATAGTAGRHRRPLYCRVGACPTVGLVTPDTLQDSQKTFVEVEEEEEAAAASLQCPSTPRAAAKRSTTAVTTTTTASVSAAAAPSIFLSPSVAAVVTATASTGGSGVDDHRRSSHPAAAHLWYLRNADFLFSVEDVGDDDDDGGLPATATTVRVALAAAAPTSIAPSPSDGSSSMYCSPQQLRQREDAHAYFGCSSYSSSATTTPSGPGRVSSVVVPLALHGMSFPHHHHHQCHATTPSSRCRWPEAFSSSPSLGTHTPVVTHANRSNSCCSSCGCSSGGVHGRDVWRSPLQWNPRQARDECEMLVAKEVAEFALTHHRARTSCAAAFVSITSPAHPHERKYTSHSSDGLTQCTSPHEPSFFCSVGAAQTSPAGALSCGFPVRDTVAATSQQQHQGQHQLPPGCGRAFSTGDLECVRTPVATAAAPRSCAPQRSCLPQPDEEEMETREEAEEEWVELLLHYRDRENEGMRIRQTLDEAAAAAAAGTPARPGSTRAPTATAMTATADGHDDADDAPTALVGRSREDHHGSAATPVAAAVARTTPALAWWATSTLMRSGFAAAPPAGRTLPHQQRRLRDATPPAALCAAMAATTTAGRTIARQVRRHLWLQREASRLHRSAYLMARTPIYASKRADGLR